MFSPLDVKISDVSFTTRGPEAGKRPGNEVLASVTGKKPVILSRRAETSGVERCGGSAGQGL